MRLRYSGRCRICSAELPARVEAIYEPGTKTVRCLTHTGEPTSADSPSVAGAREDHSPAQSTPAQPDAEPSPGAGIDPARVLSAQAPAAAGTPGASARREYDRRHNARQERVRAKHPKLGGLILALGDDPQSTRAWERGAVGEERLGERLNELSATHPDHVRVLHDRGIPRSRANIDHLAVTAAGVWIIDAKRYRGRPELKIDGGLLRPRTAKLLVGRRDHTKLVNGMRKQLTVVHTVLATAAADLAPHGVPVRGVLCFVEADWPLFGGAFSIDDIQVLWPKKLYPRLLAPGPLDAELVSALVTRLADALPPS